MKRTPMQRWWAKVEIPSGDPQACWLWSGAIMSQGYGNFYLEGKYVLAHRFGYIQFVGPIEQGLELDHKCRRRNCVNPAHVEPVTHRVNILRGDTNPARNSQKIQCPKAHPYNASNTYYSENGRHRHCRTCKLARTRAARQPKRSGWVVFEPTVLVGV